MQESIERYGLRELVVAPWYHPIFPEHLIEIVQRRKDAPQQVTVSMPLYQPTSALSLSLARVHPGTTVNVTFTDDRDNVNISGIFVILQCEYHYQQNRIPTVTFRGIQLGDVAVWIIGVSRIGVDTFLGRSINVCG